MIDDFEGLEGLIANADVYKVIAVVCESQATHSTSNVDK